MSSHSQFYAELQKENGYDYEPDSLKVMQVVMEIYLKSKSYPKSIIRDREFINCATWAISATSENTREINP